MTREALEQEQNGWEEMTVPCKHCGKDMTFNIATIGEPCEDCKYKSMAEQDQKTGHWIPITYYHMDDEEKKYHSERTGYDEKGLDIILNCPLPEDGETVLITDRLGNVEVDTFVKDCDGCYFECCDTEDVIAWMRFPEAYKGE